MKHKELPDVKHLKVFFDVTRISRKLIGRLRIFAWQNMMFIKDHQLHAAVIVVGDVACMGQIDVWCAVWKGSRVCSIEWLLSKGANGPSIKYACALPRRSL